MSASWVMGAATMGGPPLREDSNLFAYLDDTKNKLSLRKKYKSQLDEMCKKLCFDKADLDVVRKNFTKISSVLNKK
ncbi:MAG: hypothetical protein GXP13_04480 [Gammaproteobacteria bacterium]|nr:hypothetical protein [Gammaproteobacteria bacterium]